MAAFVASNSYVCTTPNQDVVYRPQIEKQRVSMCADYRFGFNDPTLWPQPYVRTYPHLAAIPRKPADSTDPLSIMWWDPTPADFVPLTGGLVSGLGQLPKEKILLFEEMEKGIQERFRHYKSSTPTPNAYLLPIERMMHYARLRLSALQLTYEQIRFCVTDFQRYYLEVRAILDYLEIYVPRMNGAQPPATEVANCIGTFTGNIHITEDFFTAGIPVWLVRPVSLFSSGFQCNILEEVRVLRPSDFICLAPHNPPFEVIYSGETAVRDKQDAIIRHTREWLGFKDAFQDISPSSTLAQPFPSTSQHTASYSSPLSSQVSIMSRMEPPMGKGKGNGKETGMFIPYFHFIIL